MDDGTCIEWVSKISVSVHFSIISTFQHICPRISIPAASPMAARRLRGLLAQGRLLARLLSDGWRSSLNTQFGPVTEQCFVCTGAHFMCVVGGGWISKYRSNGHRTCPLKRKGEGEVGLAVSYSHPSTNRVGGKFRCTYGYPCHYLIIIKFCPIIVIS